jgi:DNA-nicking Smr family endonuclease
VSTVFEVDRGRILRVGFGMAKDGAEEADEPMEMPITGELDLHTFRPSDLGALIPDYLQACRDRGILEVRVIHGKGIGNVKRSAEAILGRLDFVERFGPASVLFGGLGATMVYLKTPSKS